MKTLNFMDSRKDCYHLEVYEMASASEVAVQEGGNGSFEITNVPLETYERIIDSLIEYMKKNNLPESSSSDQSQLVSIEVGGISFYSEYNANVSLWDDIIRLLKPLMKKYD